MGVSFVMPLRAQPAHFCTPSPTRRRGRYWRPMALAMRPMPFAGSGKTPWPGLDPGMDLQVLNARSENGAGADGSPSMFASIPQPLRGVMMRPELVSGSGQTLPVPGPIRTVWVRKTVGTDEVILAGRY